jgi:hypothetical protein
MPSISLLFAYLKSTVDIPNGEEIVVNTYGGAFSKRQKRYNECVLRSRLIV